MESAIPEHLRCPRSRARCAPEGYTPSYPAWVAHHSPSVTQVVMAYFGIQYQNAGGAQKAFETVGWLIGQFAGTDGPGHFDVAHYVDEAGFDTQLVIAYWNDPAQFRRWLEEPSLRQWWKSEARSQEGVGYFREIVCPRSAHFETLFSTPDRFEGIAVLAPSRSAEIIEHGYWGGARDRLPLAQSNALLPTGEATCLAPSPGLRVRVCPHDNLTLIRSGQEWTETEGREREIYLTEVEPVLRQGMDFLRDYGLTVGCYANRYLRQVDAIGRPLEKSFGMSFWHSLAHLEEWSTLHPTHVTIFDAFMRMVHAMNFRLRLRLYHEVAVAKADEQFFEYINCHPSTGMLRVAA